MSRRLVTSNDVARQAGVSQSTVSRAFRPGAPLSPALRAKVERAAAALGYTPNAFARGMIRGQSGLVGVVVDDLLHPLQAALLDVLSSAIESEGMLPLLVRARDAADVAPALRRLESFRVDGVIACGPTLPPALRTRLAEDGVPLVLLNRYPSGRRGPAVVRTDNRAGGAEMARHLLGLGHRRFGVIAGPSDAPAAEERRAGFCAALADSGLPSPAEAAGHYTYEGGAAAALDLLGRRRRPHAIFCCNDLMALGALDAARERLGLRIPEDLAIAGFDGIVSTAWDAYRLTTMRQDVGRLAGAALDLLRARLLAPELPGTTVLVPAVLTVRASTDAALTT